MPKKDGASAYELASSIPGLSGLEVGGARLFDRATALAYKKESDRWRIRTVSLYTAFPQGTTLATAGAPAEEALRKTIQAGELLAVETIVEEASLASDQVRVEVVRLQTVDDRRDLADAAVLEANEGDRCRVVLIGLERLAGRLGRVARHLGNRRIHQEQQQIEGMAASRQETGAAEVLFDIPDELAVPGSDAVEVVHFRVMEPAEQSLIDQ